MPDLPAAVLGVNFPLCPNHHCGALIYKTKSRIGYEF